jgi:hypothetical protein
MKFWRFLKASKVNPPGHIQIAGVNTMKLSSETIRSMMKAVKSTRDEELDCGHCHEELDRFIEMKISGKKASEALPLVQEHLDRCAPCREEYEVLMEALKALSE